MGQIPSRRLSILFFVLVAIALAGCTKPAATPPAADRVGYTGALDTAYEGALDVTTQLALGTLRLEDTGDAVNREQAGRLLPLWKALQGSILQSDSERNAVVRQIEGTMSEAQVSAIAAMRLTQEDMQSWAQSQGGRFAARGGFQGPGDQGPGTQGPGSQGSGNQGSRNQGAGAQRFGGQAGQGGAPSGMTDEQIAQMRQQFQNMSPEELATRRAQFGGQGRAGGGTGRQVGGASGGLVSAVVALLSERAGVPAEAAAVRPATQSTPTVTSPARVKPVREATATLQPTATPTVQTDSTATPTPQAATEPTTAPSPTPEPVVYAVRAGDSLGAIARAYGVTVEAIVEANGITDPNRVDVGQRLILPNPARIPAGPIVTGSSVGSVGSASSVSIPAQDQASGPDEISGLEWLPDTAPGPPLTVELSANRAAQDPLVEKSRQYLVSGTVRNTGDRTYDVSTIDVTFFDASGFRGTFRKYPLVPGGEWLWHGKVEAEFPCLLLAPGETCPFLVKITAQDMASFLIHPNAVAVERQSAGIELNNLRLDDQGTRYLAISGTATNGNSFKVRNVTVAGVLLDAKGEIVSLGSTYIVQDVGPGESVTFDLRIEKVPYSRYQLYAQAERY